jgi:hypothetical protein
VSHERLAEVLAGKFVSRAEVRALAAEVVRWRTETKAPPLPIHQCACGACIVLRRHQAELHAALPAG